MMLVAQMAPNSIPSMFIFLFVGEHCCMMKFADVVDTDNHYLNTISWIMWIFSFGFLKCLYLTTLVVYFFSRIFTYLCEWEPPYSN